MPKTSNAKLTKRHIDATSYKGKGKQFHAIWDSALSGFGLRLYPSGRKAFILKYRSSGRQRMMNIGAYGEMTLDEARKRARAFLVDIEKGGDPSEDRKNEGKVPRLRVFAAEYLERHAKKYKKSWDEDERRIEKRLVPKWGNRRLDSINRDDVDHLHREIGEKYPYESNRILALIAKMYQCAIAWGRLPKHFDNPAKGIEPYDEKTRDRWVTPEEMPRLVKAVESENNLYLRSAIWMYLLTGARKSELLGLKWEWISFEQREIRLPDTKAGRVHYIPLSEPAIAILNELPRLEGNEFVFCGRKPGKPIHNIDKPWRRIRKLAEMEDVRLHDLRRTVGSWLRAAPPCS